MVHFPSVWVSKPRLISRDEYTVCKSIADSCCALAFCTFVETANFKSYKQMQDENPSSPSRNLAGSIAVTSNSGPPWVSNQNKRVPLSY